MPNGSSTAQPTAAARFKRQPPGSQSATSGAGKRARAAATALRKPKKNVLGGARVSHSVLNRRAKELGLRARVKFATFSGLSFNKSNAKLRTNVMKNLIAQAAKSKSANPIGSNFPRIWRDALPAHDELVSTSFMREFLAGFFTKSDSPLTDDQKALINNVVDQMSDIRLPTKFSGFATANKVMQHPTSRAEAFFADPYKTASLHSAMDSSRKTYVTRAMERVVTNGGTFKEMIEAGLRAGIEFTLNYFTAPVTARNVFNFSLRNNTVLTDRENLEQVEARERMKDAYEQLSGKLRIAIPDESAQQSLERDWPGLPMLGDGQEPPEAPPSPRRTTVFSSQSSNVNKAADVEMVALAL
ncbi:hypothetical protein IC762_23830 [Bradyrhizobium genosp. L]|uniref:hypothetical protein n=1 Tax=Bradyrhizobium genosp. L TaxID=83637 RepID=UPI0018A26EAF|nr:hypothetical protein [Bradyrhizobium genosp. L]QPF82759.1 hypothetical protein IC762_23830 [Bradyrhizobium genosp. L]